MFSFLTNKLYKVYDLVRGITSLKEDDLNSFFKEIKNHLIEADVSLVVINTIINDLKKKVTGVKTYKNIKPGEYLAREFHATILNLLQSNKEKGKKDILKHIVSESMRSKKPFLILFAGLQGAGKTTTIGKILFLILDIGKKLGICQKDLAVVSFDYDRPAAQEQLEIVASGLGVKIIKKNNQCELINAVREFKDQVNQNKFKERIILIDTAGRLAIDDAMMNELKKVDSILNPHEAFLVLDVMMSQEGSHVAKVFTEKINFSGIIMTKIDSDAPGGIILGLVHLLSLPIVYMTKGEKVEDIELFNPELVTKKLLGMGSIVELAKSAEKKISENEKSLQDSIKKGEVSFSDFLKIMKMIDSMGPMKSLLSMLPRDMIGGVEVSSAQLNQVTSFNRGIFIISYSMTKKEKDNPKLIMNDNSRILRISKGSGVPLNEVQRYMNMFFKMKEALVAYKRFFV